jgi:hypothetical protein
MHELLFLHDVLLFDERRNRSQGLAVVFGGRYWQIVKGAFPVGGSGRSWLKVGPERGNYITDRCGVNRARICIQRENAMIIELSSGRHQKKNAPALTEALLVYELAAV